MRAFILFLSLAAFLPFSGIAAEIPPSVDEMLHLSVQATNVRLRAGAGTDFAVLGKASKSSAQASRYLAGAKPVKDRTGQPWYKLMAVVKQQDGLAVVKLDAPCWIRGDFVRTRPLNDEEKRAAAPLLPVDGQQLSSKEAPKPERAPASPLPTIVQDAPQPASPAADKALAPSPASTPPAGPQTDSRAPENHLRVQPDIPQPAKKDIEQSSPKPLAQPPDSRAALSDAQSVTQASSLERPASDSIRATVPLWEGVIGKDIGFTMWFDVQGEQAIGELRYAKSGIPIRLVGSLREGQLYLREMLDDGSHSGFISGILENGTFTGEWRSPGKIRKNGDHFSYTEGKTYPMRAALQLGRGHLPFEWQKLPEDIGGTYRYSYGEYDSEGTLNVRRDAADRIAFNISSVNGAPAFHMADLPIEGWIEGRLEGNVLIHEESGDCAVKMTFLEELIDVSYLPGRTCPGYFGLNAGVIGMFRKVESR